MELKIKLKFVYLNESPKIWIEYGFRGKFLNTMIDVYVDKSSA